MIQGQNIICFSSEEWVSYKKNSKRHLMEIFSRTNRVLYVETVGSRSMGVNAMHLGRIGNRLAKCFREPARPPDLSQDHDLRVGSPVLIPFWNWPAAAKINDILFAAMMKKWIRKFKMENPILWFYLPMAASVLGKLGEKFVLYHCVDEWSTYPGTRSALLREREEKLLREANLTLATNRLLLKKKKPLARRIEFLPHGVDAEDFDTLGRENNSVILRPQAEESQSEILPLRYAQGQDDEKRTLAMIGGVSAWTDWGLLKFLAKRHPEWSIVLIGSVGYDADVAAISGIPNIHILGKKDYKELPAYYANVDVCIVAFEVDEHIKYSCPTRILEHLAAGKSVVTTDYPAAREYPSELVKIAKTREEFESRIGEALKENNESMISKRKKFARENTWTARAEEISSWIEGK